MGKHIALVFFHILQPLACDTQELSSPFRTRVERDDQGRHGHDCELGPLEPCNLFFDNQYTRIRT